MQRCIYRSSLEGGPLDSQTEVCNTITPTSPHPNRPPRHFWHSLISYPISLINDHYVVMWQWRQSLCASFGSSFTCQPVAKNHHRAVSLILPRTPYAWASNSGILCLTHWGRVTHIWVSKVTSIGSDNGLSPDWHQAIVWTNSEILLIGQTSVKF